ENLNVRVATFRGGRDSLDVMVATDVPAANMLRDAEIGGMVPFNVSTRIIDGTASAIQIKSSVERINADSAPDRFRQSWTQHVGRGVNVIRVDAHQPDTRRIARATAVVDTGRPTGFGMSDVLLGERPDASSAALRWSEVKMRPVAGTYRVGEPIGLVW